jgi:hypothetical protein
MYHSTFEITVFNLNTKIFMIRLLFVALICQLLFSACTMSLFDAGKTETVLPLKRAWVDGSKVEYVITDISDATMARMMGANYVPRLTNAVEALPGKSVLERVYKFENDEQISIFQSSPIPIGENNKESHYSPLWRVVMVRWIDPKFIKELTSEESLFEAEERRELTLELTNIVVNCPVTRDANGNTLRGVR